MNTFIRRRLPKMISSRSRLLLSTEFISPERVGRGLSSVLDVAPSVHVVSARSTSRKAHSPSRFCSAAPTAGQEVCLVEIQVDRWLNRLIRPMLDLLGYSLLHEVPAYDVPPPCEPGRSPRASASL